jgi:thioester reductase-like protein
MVQETIARALGLAHAEDVDVDRRLQEIGIDSLTAILVRNHLAVLTGLTLSANVVFLHQNVKALNNFLLSELQHTEGLGHPSSSAAGSSQSRDPGPRSTALSLMADPPSLNLAAIKRGCLEANLTFENAAYAITPPKSVLVTGCTGFVGAFIVHELLKRDIKVHCLVRAQGTIHARQRIVDTLIWYDLWDAAQFAPILNVVVGDITQPFLGLDEPLFNEIAETIDAICHSGALVDWMRPLDDYVGPNMVSTHEVLRLASRGRGKAVHFVSTIATVPWHVGWDLPEDQYEYYYATSKYTAERMVAAARWRGAKASVYRLPFVSASSVTGHFRLDRGDFLHNLITGSIEMGSFPLLAADMSIVLPVDYLCSSIVNVITREVSRIGQDFDFKNERAPSFVDFFKMMIAVGDSGELIPFIEWRQRALAYSAAYPTSSLARIAAVLDGCDETSVTAMFGTLPLGQHVFGGSDYAVPLVSHDFVRRYLSRIYIAKRGEPRSNNRRMLA